MTVDRYEFVYDYADTQMFKCDDGEYVTYDDYAALEARLKLADELAEATEWLEERRQEAIARIGLNAVEDKFVKDICERFGYGAVMDSASRQWARKTQWWGAFFIGGCIGDESAKQALSVYKASEGGE